MLSDIDKLKPNPAPLREEAASAEEDVPARSLHELQDELQAHLDRIMQEEGYGWEVREWWFEDGAEI